MYLTSSRLNENYNINNQYTPDKIYTNKTNSFDKDTNKTYVNQFNNDIEIAKINSFNKSIDNNFSD